jgi:hypothetical protein
MMTGQKKQENDIFLSVLVVFWIISLCLVGIGLLFTSYTPVPASAQIAGFIQTSGMVMLIVASIAGCIYIARLIHHSG